jgi:hypothetical protein
VLRGGTGSSDIGNVSLALPAIHPYMQVMDAGTPTHSRAMAEAVVQSRADTAMVQMATALACSGADLLADPNLFAQVREEFATRGPACAAPPSATLMSPPTPPGAPGMRGVSDPQPGIRPRAVGGHCSVADRSDACPSPRPGPGPGWRSPAWHGVVNRNLG